MAQQHPALTFLQQMRVADLASACCRETSAFQRGQIHRDEFCWELFRRAVCEREPAAWEAILTQYRGLVLAWVRQHPVSATTSETDDYWVNRTFERFWSAVGPDRFGMFRDLQAILHYMKACAHCALLNERRTRHANRLESLELLAEDNDRQDGGVEGPVISGAVAQELWEAITKEVTDESERLVLYLSLALELKPREIRARHPEHFPAVADVHRIKRNVLERLRRSPAIRRFLT